MEYPRAASSAGELYRVLARVLYLAAALVVTLWLLYRVEPILLASILALILALAVNAPVTWLERKNVSRTLATILVFIVLVVGTALLGWLIVPRLADEIPTLIEQIPALITELAERVSETFGEQPVVQQQLARVVDWVLGVFEGLWRYADLLAGAAVMGIFVVALALYMVANLRALLKWHIRSMPIHLRDPAARAFARASKMVIGWVIASVILGGIKAVAAFLFLMLFGVPGALLWSILAFFGAFIPRIGFYLMTIPPVLVAFTVDPLTALWTAIFYIVFSEILGNFVAPRIYAETMELNAVLILFMTIAMGYAFGLIGVLIASPIAGFLKAYYDEFYLARMPEDPEVESRVRAMMNREPSRRAPDPVPQ